MFVFELVLHAGILGVVLALMERDSFPGWGPLIGCAWAIAIVSNLVGHFLPGLLSLLGVVAGALAGALLISWMCEIPRRRATVIAATYLGVAFVAELALALLAG